MEDLIDSLYIDDNEFHIHIGKINYIDYRREHIAGYEDFASQDLTDPNVVLKLFYTPVMHKRNIFKDEEEVRAIISFESICKTSQIRPIHQKYRFIVTDCSRQKSII